jgi:xanthine dehydrogenase accessory factor
MSDDFFTKASELLTQGTPFATATVVRAEKPTSGKPGDKAIISADGTLHGWIGGSCAEPTVVKQALKSLEDNQSRFLRLSADPDKQTPRDGLIDLPLTCFSGGTLEIFIEPQHAQARLLIVGELPIARALIDLGKVMNYRVMAVTLDADAEKLAKADEVVTSLEDAARWINQDTFVVVATHGNYDEMALEPILKAGAGYVGLVASRKRFESVLEYLRTAGLDESQLHALKAPAGLDIQAQRPDEIALSILAEIVQYRRNRPAHYDLSVPVHEHRHEHHHEHQHHQGIAIDPVCGMEVDIATAKYTHEYEGQTYYFCAAGCKTTFAKNPDDYLQREPPSGIAIDPVCDMEVDIATAKYMSEYEGQIYYFCAPGCKRSFEKDPLAYIHISEA